MHPIATASRAALTAWRTGVSVPATPMPHLLLVEDNDMNRDMLRRRLERRGFRITEACDGLEALAAVRHERPDLILMDMGLPRLDGWDATRALKNDPAYADLPIVAITGHVMDADRKRALDAGCDAFYPKPIDLEALLQAVDSLLPRKTD